MSEAVTEDSAGVQVFLETVPSQDRELIIAAGKKVFSTNPPREIWARSLGRFGYSGSRLYVGRFRVSPHARTPNHLAQFAIKIGSVSRIMGEQDKTEAAREFDSRIYSAIAKRDSAVQQPGQSEAGSGEELAALILRFEGSGDGHVLELRDLLVQERLKATARDAVVDSVSDYLKVLFVNHLETFHQAHEPKDACFGNQYQLSDDDLASVQTRLDAMDYGRVPHSVDKSPASELASPKHVYQRLAKLERKLLCGPIHGDVHPSNVLLCKSAGGKFTPQLIDFADYDPRGHVLRDFVLMECSLRFHRFQRSINFTEQQKFDDYVLKALFQATPSRELGCQLNAYNRDNYVALYDSVLMIRNCAKTRTESFGHLWNPEDYCIALFMRLYHLLKYETYSHSAAFALGQLAAYIQKTVKLPA